MSKHMSHILKYFTLYAPATFLSKKRQTQIQMLTMQFLIWKVGCRKIVCENVVSSISLDSWPKKTLDHIQWSHENNEISHHIEAKYSCTRCYKCLTMYGKLWFFIIFSFDQIICCFSYYRYWLDFEGLIWLKFCGNTFYDSSVFRLLIFFSHPASKS